VTAIAGYLSCGGSVRPADACAELLAAQAALGPHDRAIRSIDRISFGRNLFKLLPEDAFDRQPLLGGGGRHMLTADIRIDNRSELAEQLAVGHEALRRLSDADLLLVAWEKWNEGALDRILGDFAFALWDAEQQQLSLVRSALALKPLFYHVGSDFIAFASAPSGLHALGSIRKALNRGQAASYAAGVIPQGSATIFQAIERVKPGHMLRFKGQRAEASQFWDVRRGELRLRKPDDYAEALREHLDRAVAARLRRFGGEVASHLSGGRDSNAVAATAAGLLSADNERLLAYTAAPRIAYPGPTIKGTLADESALAAATAYMHPNMDHFICRPDGRSAFVELEQIDHLNEGPFGHLSNLSWWSQINDDASRRGASILLVGQAGNFGLSAGGESHLPDLLRESGLTQWWQAARGFGGGSVAGWRSVLNRSFGHFLPRALYSLALRASGREAKSTFDIPFLRTPYREQAEADLGAELGELRPPRSFFEYRREMVLRRDDGSKISQARWGIDTRDPTSDRRLVEFCFSLPVEALIAPGKARPLFEAAMSDRIAPQVLSSLLRGYQAADWHETITKSEVSERFNRYKQHDLVGELLDVDHVQSMIDRWPSSGWEDRKTMSLYRNELLGVLSLADFIVVNF